MTVAGALRSSYAPSRTDELSEEYRLGAEVLLPLA